MRDLASQAIYCHFTKDRSSAEIIRSFAEIWDLNPSWRAIDSHGSRFIRMDSERGYQARETKHFIASLGYQMEVTPPRDKHAGGIAERTIGLVTSKANAAMLHGRVPPSFWCWAMLKTTQDLNFSYNSKIKDSPYHFITGQHVDIKHLHAFFAICWMFIPLKDRERKLPAPRAQLCRFLSYSFTTIMVPTYNVIVVHDRGTYGRVRTSKDITFDETYQFEDYPDNYIEDDTTNSSTLPIQDISDVLAPPTISARIIGPTIIHPPSPDLPTQPLLEFEDDIYLPNEYWQRQIREENQQTTEQPLYVADTSEFEERINQHGNVQYWNSVIQEWIYPEIRDVTNQPYSVIMSMYLDKENVPAYAPKSFRQAVLLPQWRDPIIKELDNFQSNTCFQWIPDTGQRRLHMIWLFSYKANYDLKARMVVNGSQCVPGLDYNPAEVYCGNVQAASIKIFFALSALYGLTMRGGDLVGAYLVTPGSKEYKLCISTPAGIKAPPGMILEVLGNLYGLPSSGRNFSKAVDEIVAKCGYINTPYDPKFFVKWIDKSPILLMFHSDDFRWSGAPAVMHEWDLLVKAFEASKYKVKDCTSSPFVGINITTGPDGSFHLDMQEKIEGVATAARVRGAPKQKLPYPLEGESLSKKDNAKDDAEAAKMATLVDYRKLIGMLSYIMAHTKPDIAYALNVLSRYCNNPGPRHVEFLLCLVKYCWHTKCDRLHYPAHPGPYDEVTMHDLTQLRFQCDADLAGNKDNGHSTSSYIGYIGRTYVVCYQSKTQGSLSTSTAESEIKAVNHCLKEEALAMRRMLIAMGFKQDATFIEEDNLACCYASETPHLTRGLRHMQLADMLLKNMVADKEIKLVKVASEDNTSDLGTKRLQLHIFNKLTSRIIDKSQRTNL